MKIPTCLEGVPAKTFPVNWLEVPIPEPRTDDEGLEAAFFVMWDDGLWEVLWLEVMDEQVYLHLCVRYDSPEGTQPCVPLTTSTLFLLSEDAELHAMAVETVREEVKTLIASTKEKT
jgi:hypothetical protein